MMLLRMILLVTLLLATTDFASAAPVPMEKAELKSKKLEELWKFLLLGDDEPLSAKALLELSARPTAKVVEFLGEKLKPINITKEKLEKLIGELGDENEEVADAAYSELGYFDPRLELDLETIMKLATSKRHKERMAALISGNSLEHANGFEWCIVQLSVHNMPAPKVGKTYMFTVSSDPNKPAGFRTGLERAGVFGGAIKPIPSAVSKLQLPQWNRATRAVKALEDLNTPEAIKVLEAMATGHMDASPTKAATEALARLKK